MMSLRRIFLLLLSLPCLISAQRNYLNLDVAAGVSSFSGLALNTSLSYERKNNVFTLRYFYNQQIKSVQQLVENDEDNHVIWYGDRFRDVSLLYGRTYRKNKLTLSLSCGIGTYKYTQITLVNLRDPAAIRALDDYEVSRKIYYGLGLASQAEISGQICHRMSLGLSLASNVNKDKSILAVCAKLSFDISTAALRDFKNKAQ